MRKISNAIKKFYEFLKKDSLPSIIVYLFLAFIVIKFIFFPILSLLTGSPLPLVIVESCSMHHKQKGFERVFKSPIYQSYGLKIEDTKNWIFQNGFNKGDVIFVVSPKNIKVGDVIIFEAGTRFPLIHRVIEIKNNSYSTKGDNLDSNSGQLPYEINIKKEQVLGKALFRIPFIGWVKLIFFDHTKPPQERGFCR